MANTRKPARPKAGAKPTSKEIYEDSGVLELIEDTGGTIDDLPDLYGEDADDEIDVDVPYTPTAEEIAAVLAFIKSQTVSEILKDNTDYALNVADAMLGVLPVEKSTKELFVKVYDVVDTITGTSIRPEDNGALTLSGRVTDADLDAAGVDKAWLLRIGAIVDAGYAGG